MGAIVKFREGKGWFVQINEGGKRKSKKARNEAEAVAAAAEYNRKKTPQPSMLLIGPKLFSIVAEAWWDAHSGSWAETTRMTRRCGLVRLLNRIGSRDIRTLDDKSVHAIAQSLCPPFTTLKHATVTFTGDQLAAVVKFALDNKLLKEKPGKKSIRGIFEQAAGANCAPPDTADSWTHAEAAQLLQMAAKEGDWLYQPALFALRSGCRIGELVALDWKDVDLERGLVTFRQSKSLKKVKGTKTKKIRTRALSTDLRTMLGDMEKRRKGELVFLNSLGEPWLAGSLSSIWCKKRRLCPKVAQLKWHCFRHTFASWALDEGWKASDAAWYIGDTLEVFLKHYQHRLRDKHLDLDFFNRSPNAGDPPQAPALPGSVVRHLQLVPQA